MPISLAAMRSALPESPVLESPVLQSTAIDLAQRTMAGVEPSHRNGPTSHHHEDCTHHPHRSSRHHEHDTAHAPRQETLAERERRHAQDAASHGLDVATFQRIRRADLKWLYCLRDRFEHNLVKFNNSDDDPVDGSRSPAALQATIDQFAKYVSIYDKYERRYARQLRNVPERNESSCIRHIAKGDDCRCAVSLKIQAKMEMYRRARQVGFAMVLDMMARYAKVMKAKMAGIE